MKSNRFFQLAASFVLVFAFTFSLDGCSGGDIPDGRYVKIGSEKYWEFSGDKATYYFNKDYPAQKGTYKIDTNGLFIFTLENGTIDKKMFGIEGNKLLLGNTQYTRQ